MSRGRHRLDGQRRDALRARARDTWTRLRALWAGLQLWLAWWEWPLVQAHWYRQFKRADRKAFAAECEEIRARAAMTPAPDRTPVQAPRPADPPLLAARCGPGQPMTPGAVCADDGTGTDAGAVPSPAAADAVPPAAQAATLPPPAPPQVTGRGQPDHLWPGGPVTAPAGSRRSNEQQFARAPQHLPWVTFQGPPGSPLPAYRGDYRPTEPMRAVGELTPVSVIRPYYPALEAWRDTPAGWTA